jgi:hypothetical protein
MDAKDNEEVERLSPAAKEACAELVRIFSDPNLPFKPRFRCSVEGPDEFDVMFESILDDQFGHDPNSEYKQWVRRLYQLGFIPPLPREWK